jgi:hypothetical protein
MRRLIVATLAVAVAIALPGSGSAMAGRRASSPPLALQRQWVNWAFGSSSNPLMQEDLCGEQIGDTFFLTSHAGPGTRELTCEIPAGVPVLVTPGGAIVWAPTDGETGSELYSTLLNDFLGKIILDSVRVTLDGQRLRRGPLTITGPRELRLEPGNLIQTVDPSVEGDSTVVMTGGWFRLISPLSQGQHVLRAAQRVRGVGRSVLVLEISVT